MDTSFLYHVAIKNDRGEYEDLGVMTAAEAHSYSWEHGHRTLNMTKVGENVSR